MTPEGYVKAKVREIYREFNVHYHHVPRGGYGNNGAPDYICNVNAYCETECKSVKGKSKGKQTLLQQINQEKCEKSGGIYWLVHEENLAQYREFIRGRMSQC